MTVFYRLVRPGAPGEVRLTRTQDEIAAHRRGARIVLGSARTGKTTALVNAGVAALSDGFPHVLLLVNSRRARIELKTAISTHRPALAPRFDVATFHSLSQRILQLASAGERVPAVVSAARQDGYVRQILAGQSENAWPPGFGLAMRTKPFAAQVREAIADCQRVGLTPRDVLVRGTQQGRDDWIGLAGFYQEYLDILGLAEVMDYPEALIRANQLLREATVLPRVRPPGSLILVDDAEDMDDLQTDVVAGLVDGRTPVILAVDPDRRVYGFRGSKPRSILSLMETWSEQGIGTVATSLDTGFGVAAEIMAACRELRGRIPLTAGIAATALEAYRNPRPDGTGQAERRVFTDPSQEAWWVAGILLEAHVVGRTPYEDMAVVVRRRSDLSLHALACQSLGVPVTMSSDEIQLSQESVVTRLLAGLRLVRDGERGKVSDLRDVVSSGLSGSVAPQEHQRARMLVEAEGFADDAQGGEATDRGVAWVFSGREDLPLSRLRAVMRAGRKALEEAHWVGEILWEMWSTSPWQDDLLDQIASGGSEALRAHRDLDAVNALFALAGQFADVVAERGITALDDAVSSQEIPDNLPRSSSWTGAAVRLTTAHRAKSASWALTVVAGVNENAWPGQPQPSPMIPLEGLSAQMVPGSERDRVAAERRLLYSACASARQHLVLTAVDDEDSRPSGFFWEIDSPVYGPSVDDGFAGSSPGVLPEGDAVPGGGGLSASALVGGLRRVAADQSAHPGLRQAALDRLAGLALEPGFPGASPDQWWGKGDVSTTLVEGANSSGGSVSFRAGSTPVDCPGTSGDNAPVTLSGSSTQALLECPRRWWLSRRVGAERPSGPATRIGSLIHSLIQDPNAPAEQMSTDLDEAWAGLMFTPEWRRVSEYERAQAMIARYDAYRRVRAREVLASEMDVHLEMDCGGPVVIRGRIDRVERDHDGRVWIVDFKTGRAVPTAVEARANIQLGLYQLALDSSAGSSTIGHVDTIGGAELVYLDRDEKKGSGLPKVLVQPSIRTEQHLATPCEPPVAEWEALAGVGDQWGYPTWVHHRIALAGSILRGGAYPAVRSSGCRGCSFRSGCPAIPWEG